MGHSLKEREKTEHSERKERGAQPWGVPLLSIEPNVKDPPLVIL